MVLAATAGPPEAGYVALPVGAGPELLTGTSERAAGLGADLGAALARDEAKGEPGEIVRVPSAAVTVLAYGTGDGSPLALRRAGAAVVRAAKGDGALVVHPPPLSAAADVAALVEGLRLAGYGFARKSGDLPKPVREITVVGGDPRGELAAAVERARVTTEAVALARDLANTPSLEKTPQWLAEQAAAVGERAGLTVKIWDEQQLAAGGFGGILAVGMGSVRPPRLIQLSYAPRGAAAARAAGPHVVLVGKGITFDSGGLSIKPTDGMTTMKTDMAGGAAVIAAMSALRELGVRMRVTALVPAAENMPSGSAQRPGDVIRHWNGMTTEVLNTDAEGRLVLADALSYAAARLRPDVIVDLATLTGAASLGLGKYHGALYATDDQLGLALQAAGDASGDRAWRMPLVEDYRDAVVSDIADLRNVGDPEKHYQGGSITAALYLREFTRGLPWAHLDIAGPARSDKDEHEITKGATGYGVRLLLHWLESLPTD